MLTAATVLVLGLCQASLAYLHPKAGRFLQRDPPRYVDGPNLYGYLRGDPAGRLDPRGTQSLKVEATHLCSGGVATLRGRSGGNWIRRRGLEEAGAKVKLRKATVPGRIQGAGRLRLGLRRMALATVILMTGIAALLILPRYRDGAPRLIAERPSRPDLEALVAEPGLAGDVALANLMSATGLAGAEQLDVERVLDELDRWSAHVRAETERHLHKFRLAPHDYRGSEAYFRILTLVTVLQQDFGVRYSSDRAQDPDARNSKDLLIHGLVGDPNGGTCASMPVAYIAVGRRLGYPLKLVAAKGHLFARWDDGNEQFNIEATNEGLNTFDDAHYRSWPAPMNDEEALFYLKSMTPAEELAAFLALRGDCLAAHGRLAEAQLAYAQAHHLAPDFPPYLAALAQAVRQEVAGAPPR